MSDLEGRNGQMAHLDAEVLAEFRAGLITGRRGARITAHLAGCDRCTALGDQLAGVSALLASVPVPAMPDRVAQRLDTVLDTVLAAEAAHAGQAERAGADRPARPATARRRTPRPGFRLLSARVLAPVAVAVLAAGGYGLSRVIEPGGLATASSAASAGRPVAGASTQGGAKAAAGAASGHVNAPQSAPARSTAGTAPRAQRLTPYNFSLVTSTVNFSSAPATLRQQIEHELGTTPPAAASATAPPVTTRLRDCVQNLTRGASLVRVESVRFQDEPATLVVARTGQHETAWIAGPNCSATSRDILARTTLS